MIHVTFITILEFDYSLFISCQRCHEKESRYTCPKCLVVYCSADCYKTEAHIQCSETFYKHCVYEELASKDLKNKMHMNKHKIEDVLKQLSQAEDTELLDSDDSASEVELEDRLRNVDLDSPSDVWASLTNEEKNEFQQLVDSGKILECLPAWEPWWISDTRFIVEEIDHESSRSVAHIPSIKHPIVALSQLTVSIFVLTRLYGAILFNIYNFFRQRNLQKQCGMDYSMFYLATPACLVFIFTSGIQQTQHPLLKLCC